MTSTDLIRYTLAILLGGGFGLVLYLTIERFITWRNDESWKRHLERIREQQEMRPSEASASVKPRQRLGRNVPELPRGSASDPLRTSLRPNQEE